MIGTILLCAIQLTGVTGKDLRARAYFDANNVKVGDPLVLTQISAVTQFVMCPKCPKAPARRKLWTAALERAREIFKISAQQQFQYPVAERTRSDI